MNHLITDSFFVQQAFLRKFPVLSRNIIWYGKNLVLFTHICHNNWFSKDSGYFWLLQLLIQSDLPGFILSSEISAVQNFFINKESCSALNQYWITTVNYLKFSEQQCSALKTHFTRVKKIMLNSAVSKMIFWINVDSEETSSELDLFGTG